MRARPDDRTPSEPPETALQVKICSSLPCSLLHPLKGWSLRQTRRGSILYRASPRHAQAGDCKAPPFDLWSSRFRKVKPATKSRRRVNRRPSAYRSRQSRNVQVAQLPRCAAKRFDCDIQGVRRMAGNGCDQPSDKDLLLETTV